jgi:hypothetical protein
VDLVVDSLTLRYAEVCYVDDRLIGGKFEEERTVINVKIGGIL